MSDEVKVLSGDSVLYSDGEATLSFQEEVGLSNEVQGKWFGLVMSNGGGFSCLCLPVEGWEQIKKRVDELLVARNKKMS